MQKFKELFESTQIEEGEIWDLFKGTAQLYKIMDWGKKEVVKRLADAKKEGQSDEELVKTFASVVADVEKKVNGTSLPDSMKQSTIKSFKDSILKGVSKNLK